MNIERELVLRFRQLMAGGGVVGYGLVFVYSQEARISANKAFIEYTARKLIKVLAFQCFQMTA